VCCFLIRKRTECLVLNNLEKKTRKTNAKKKIDRINYANKILFKEKKSLLDAEKSIHHHWGSAIEVCLFLYMYLALKGI